MYLCLVYWLFSAYLVLTHSTVASHSTTRNAIMAVKAECTNIGRHHTEFGNQLSKELCAPLTGFLADQKKARSKQEKDIKKLAGDLEQLRKTVRKLRDKYEKVSREAEAAEAALEHAHHDRNATRAEFARLTQKLQKASKEAQSAEDDYRDNVQKMQHANHRFEDSLCATFDDFQRQEEQRIEYFRGVLQKFVAAQESSIPALQQGIKMMGNVVEAVDAKHDIQLFIADRRTGNERIPVEQFIEFERATPDSASGRAPIAKAGSKSNMGNADKNKSKAAPAKAKAGPSAAKSPSRDRHDHKGSSSGKQLVRAIYEFPGEEEDELGFPKGAVITVVSQDASGWWTGEYRGKTGTFPSNRTEPA